MKKEMKNSPEYFDGRRYFYVHLYINMLLQRLFELIAHGIYFSSNSWNYEIHLKLCILKNTKSL